ASAGARQANSAKRIELYGFLQKRVLVDGRTKLRRGVRCFRLEIVGIGQVGPETFGNKFWIYVIAAIAEVFWLQLVLLFRAPQIGVDEAKFSFLLERECRRQLSDKLVDSVTKFMRHREVPV